MYCNQCGSQVNGRYCAACGRPTGRSSRRLTLSATGKQIGGVCAGLAEYFCVDVTLVRILFLVLVFIPPGAGLIAYVVAWLLMPSAQEPALADQS